jgi:hypothetical protein
MVTTVSSLELPNYDKNPFFLSTFQCSIAIGSFFIFTRPDDRRKQLVGQIVKATKSVDQDQDDKEDHAVTVNLFLSFDEWPPKTTLHPIKEVLGKNLHEVVLTSHTCEFLFDRDVCDIGFVFTTFELARRGARHPPRHG